MTRPDLVGNFLNVFDMHDPQLVETSTTTEAEVDRLRREVEQLRQALGNSRTIGAAIGIAMATLRLTEEQAFAVLVRASQTANRKLRDVAHDVVFTGAVPGQGTSERAAS